MGKRRDLSYVWENPGVLDQEEEEMETVRVPFAEGEGSCDISLPRGRDYNELAFGVMALAGLEGFAFGLIETNPVQYVLSVFAAGIIVKGGLFWSDLREYKKARRAILRGVEGKTGVRGLEREYGIV